MFCTLDNLLLQTVKNLTCLLNGFGAVGKISKLELFHNPSASHKIILLRLWLSVVCVFQIWQLWRAFVVQLMQQQINARQTCMLEITYLVVSEALEIFICF